jgi:hypothetical protein
MFAMSNPIISTLLQGRLTLVVLLCYGAMAAAADPASKPARSVLTIRLNVPKGSTDGELVVIAPKQALLAELEKAIPETVAIPNQKLGNQAIYRDVKLTDLKVGQIKPRLSIDHEAIQVVGTPRLTGKLDALYEHVVVTTEVKTIAKVLGREVKQSVPVVHSDWRPKGAMPFTIDAQVSGTCVASFPTAKSLDDQRIRLDTRATQVKITDIHIETNDPLVQAVVQLLAVVGRAFPNEGLNAPIRDALTRRIEIDPFNGFNKDQRKQFKAYRVKSVTIKTTPDEVRVVAVLANRA